jgi:hypothetical protein
MKKLFDFKNLGSVLLMLSVFASSCKQEANFQPVSMENEPKTLKMSGINEVKGDFTVQDGVLHFSNPKALFSVLEQLRQYDISERRNFGLNFGFTSMLNGFCDVLLKSSTFEELEQKNAYLKQNEDIITYDEERGINFKIANAHLASILDRKGNLYVGKAVYKFTEFGEAIALDGDKSKLESITSNTKSDRNIKIFATKQELNTRAACGSSQFKTQTVNGDRKGDLTSDVTNDYFYYDTDPVTQEDRYYNVGSSYTYGKPYKRKCNIFGRNCSLENYSTNNTLSVNHKIVTYNGLFSTTDNLSYSNNFNIIDYDGNYVYTFEVPISQLSPYFFKFEFMNPNRYQMTNTGVDIQILCN